MRLIGDSPSESSKSIKTGLTPSEFKISRFEFPWHDFSLWSVSLCFSYSATFSFSLILLEMIPYCVATLIFAEIVVNRRQKVQISSCELDWLSFFHFHAVFSSSSSCKCHLFCCIRLITKDRMFGRCSRSSGPRPPPSVLADQTQESPGRGPGLLIPLWAP